MKPTPISTRRWKACRQAFGQSVVPFALPILTDGKMTGVVDVIEEQAYALDAKTGAATPMAMPAALQDTVSGIRDSLNETVAETDEALMEKFFSGETFTPEELTSRLARRHRRRLAESGLCRLRHSQLGDQLHHGPPGPLYARAFRNRPPARPNRLTAPHCEITADAAAPLAAFVFKTIADPFVGRISLFRVYSGTFKANSTVYNPLKEKDERIGSLFMMVGKKQLPADQVGVGDIGAVTKLLVTTTNDTLCDRSRAGHSAADQIPGALPVDGHAAQGQGRGRQDHVRLEQTEG